MPDNLTPERRAEIRARAEAATEGPWEGWQDALSHPTGEVIIAEIEEAYEAWGGVQDTPRIKMDWADAQFIAHAREDIPALLDALDAADARIAELEGMLSRLQWLPLRDEVWYFDNDCPICYGTKSGGHYDDCELARLLATPQPTHYEYASFVHNSLDTEQEMATWAADGKWTYLGEDQEAVCVAIFGRPVTPPTEDE